jgi:hypothetical protein
MGERQLHYKRVIFFVQIPGKNFRTAEKKIHPFLISHANRYTFAIREAAFQSKHTGFSMRHVHSITEQTEKTLCKFVGSAGG